MRLGGWSPRPAYRSCSCCSLPRPVCAQRLPANRDPRALRSGVRRRHRRQAVRGNRNDSRPDRSTDGPHRAERGRDRLRRRDHRYRRGDAARQRRTRSNGRDRNADRRESAARRARGDPDPLHRRAERPAPRLLHHQGRDAELCRHAVRVDGRAAGVSLLRRAGLQGHLRGDADDRSRRHRDLERSRHLGHAGARSRPAHGEVLHVAEDVVVSRGDGRGRLRVSRRRRRRHADSRMHAAGKEGSSGESRSSRRRRS